MHEYVYPQWLHADDRETHEWCQGLNSFLWRNTFCNELPLHTIGPCFIAISGAIMSPHGYKKILMRAVSISISYRRFPKNLAVIK